MSQREHDLHMCIIILECEVVNKLHFTTIKSSTVKNRNHKNNYCTCTVNEIIKLPPCINITRVKAKCRVSIPCVGLPYTRF